MPPDNQTDSQPSSQQASQTDSPQAILLATRNKGKIREFADLLAPFGLTVVGLDAFPHLADVEETGVTFVENALLKACEAAGATGLLSVADDSGLEVDALNGAPGVHSARYSAQEGTPATDERNTQKLLQALAGVPPEKRSCRFRCCMAACAPNGERLVAEGAWEGLVALSPKGDQGFGYDPVFFDPELGLTAAQLQPEQKNARSHRARAVKALLEKWPAFLQTTWQK